MTVTIRWTDRERKAVASRYAELVYGGQKEGLATFRTAQQSAIISGTLSKDREREVSSMQAIGTWFVPLTLELLEQINIEAQEQALSADVSVAEPEAVKEVDLAVATTDNLLAELMRRALGSMLANPTFLAPVVEQLAEQLQPVITAAVKSELQSLAQMQIGQQANQLTVPLQRTCVPSGPKKRKIVIIGLKGGQPQQVKQKIPDDFTLTFYESRVPASQLKATLRHTDHVFFMSDWSSHSAQSVVKNSNVPFEYVSGTVTNLVRRISEFAAS